MFLFKVFSLHVCNTFCSVNDYGTGVELCLPVMLTFGHKLVCLSAFFGHPFMLELSKSSFGCRY